MQIVPVEKGDREMRTFTKCQKSFLVVGLLLFGLLGTADVSPALDVGDKAPDFTLPSTNGVDISLSDFRGKKWVFLEFYAAAFVPT
jgi:AhpC/TSA family